MGSIPLSGGGTRARWYPRKAAFRAGKVTGQQWDEASVGHGSVAFGFETEASGANSTALGRYTHALGLASVAGGIRTTAEGVGARAMGVESYAGGNHSVAFGYGAITTTSAEG